MADGDLDQAVDSLLNAAGDLDEIPMSNIDTQIDAAIANVRAASDTVLDKYIAMLHGFERFNSSFLRAILHWNIAHSGI